MRPRTSLAPQKAISQNHGQKFPHFLICPSVVTKTDLHPPWNVHLWVSELPSSRGSSLLQDLGYTALRLHGAVQETMCHVTLSQMLEPREAHVPVWDPASGSGLTCSVGSEFLVGPTSPGPTSIPIHIGSRARGPERPNARNPEGGRLHQALKSCT